nr:IS110 family transposase [Streptomyces sp. RPA4-2]
MGSGCSTFLAEPVHHAPRGYHGDGKTDAKDAYVIADQARMRRDPYSLCRSGTRSRWT